MTLPGQQARYVRLQLPGTSYFHLDEVEIYAAGGNDNIALGKPATQSSTSQWSASARPAAARPPATPIVAEVVSEGCSWPSDLRSAAWHVRRRRTELQAMLDARGAAAGRRCRADAAAAVLPGPAGPIRELALRNPLLDFDTILFVKRAPTLFPHMSRPVLRLVVAAGRRHLPARRASRGDEPHRAVPDDELAAGQFHRPGPVVRRPQGAVRLLPVLSRPGRRGGQDQQGRSCRRTPSTTSSR